MADFNLYSFICSTILDVGSVFFGRSMKDEGKAQRVVLHIFETLIHTVLNTFYEKLHKPVKEEANKRIIFNIEN